MSWLAKILVLCLVIFDLGLASQARASIRGQNLITGETTEVAPGKKGTVLVFMSSVCPCSDSHVPLVKKLADEYKDFQFVVVHSNVDEDSAGAKSYFKKAEFSFPVLQDDKAKLADEFKAYKTPHVFLITAEGKILYRGGMTNSNLGPTAEKQYLRDALADVMANQPVRVTEGRTLGCIISRDGAHGS